MDWTFPFSYLQTSHVLTHSNHNMQTRMHTATVTCTPTPHSKTAERELAKYCSVPTICKTGVQVAAVLKYNNRWQRS
jgi:hypothetical protein